MNYVKHQSIVKKGGPSQYCLYLHFDNGAKTTRRLKGCYPTADCFDNEPDEIKARVELEKLNVIIDLQDNPARVSKCPYKTINEAWVDFVEYRRSEGRKSPSLESAAKHFLKRFGDRWVADVSSKDVIEWARESAEKGVAYTYMESMVRGPYQLYKWLIAEHSLNIRNPLTGFPSKQERYFKPSKLKKCTITDIELAKLMRHSDKYPSAARLIFFAYHTGLRIAEIINRLDTDNLDKSSRSWSFVAIEKSSGVSYWRKISVPEILIDYIEGQGIDGKVEFIGHEKQFQKLRKAAGTPQVLLKTFRSDFSNRMRAAGATKDQINFHQGRDRDVLEKHYLDLDSGVADTRKLIDLMFASNTGNKPATHKAAHLHIAESK